MEIEIVILCQYCGQEKDRADYSPEPYCEQCLCRRCRCRPNDDGEGYDGLCGNCADLAEVERLGSDFQ